jgi:cell division septum initiation protein DivIVA
MLATVKTLVQNLHEENQGLKEEVKELKQKLQHRHTEINDLRYAKKQLLRVVENVTQK